MIAMGCAICQEQKYIAHKGQQPLPRCERHPDRCMIDWSYIKRYSEDKLLGEIVSDQYVLIRPLGKGGFGSVYFAIQMQNNQSKTVRKSVAIKFLTKVNENHIKLFNDEMRLMSQLRNQYIVQLFGSGQHQSPSAGNTLPYMIMEFVEGETLSGRLVRQGALKPRQVILLVKQLLSALIEAHDKGIIHRDLKPLNLMICPDSKDDFRLIVLDFGISKMVDDSTREATRNKIMGTPYYLAPEILLKGELSHHTDLFAVAVIAYESLSFHSPFLNEELSGIEPYLRLRSIYKDQKKPDPLPAHLPIEWTQFFECALHSNPQHRFPDAESMLIAIEALEQMTLNVHQEIEEKSPVGLGDFEDDDETMLFKKKLMGLSKSHDPKKVKSLVPDAKPRNHETSELSVLESVDMIDPVEVLTSKITIPALPSQVAKQANEPVDQAPKLSPIFPSQAKPVQPPPLPIPSLPRSSPPPLPEQASQSKLELTVPMTKQSSDVAVVTKKMEQFSANRTITKSSSISKKKTNSSNENANLLSISSPDVLTIQVGSASPLLGDLSVNNKVTKSMEQVKRHRQSSVNQLGRRNSALHTSPYRENHEDTQKRKTYKQSNSFIWLQLLIMVGLGVGFAYVVAHYILN